MAKNRYNDNNGGSELATILGRDGSFNGKLTVKHSIRVDGNLNGELHTSETLTVGKEGLIEGIVTAKNLIIGGKIKGTVTVTGKTTLESTSTLEGELKTGKLVIEESATLHGTTDMSASAKPTAGSGKIFAKKKDAE